MKERGMVDDLGILTNHSHSQRSLATQVGGSVLTANVGGDNQKIHIKNNPNDRRSLLTRMPPAVTMTIGKYSNARRQRKLAFGDGNPSVSSQDFVDLKARLQDLRRGNSGSGGRAMRRSSLTTTTTTTNSVVTTRTSISLPMIKSRAKTTSTIRPLLDTAALSNSTPTSEPRLTTVTNIELATPTTSSSSSQNLPAATNQPKRVHFPTGSTTSAVHFVVHRKDLTDEERSQYWFAPKEERQQRRQAKRAAFRLALLADYWITLLDKAYAQSKTLANQLDNYNTIHDSMNNHTDTCSADILCTLLWKNPSKFVFGLDEWSEHCSSYRGLELWIAGCSQAHARSSSAKHYRQSVIAKYKSVCRQRQRRRMEDGDVDDDDELLLEVARKGVHLSHRARLWARAMGQADHHAAVVLQKQELNGANISADYAEDVPPPPPSAPPLAAEIVGDMKAETSQRRMSRRSSTGEYTARRLSAATGTSTSTGSTSLTKSYAYTSKSQSDPPTPSYPPVSTTGTRSSQASRADGDSNKNHATSHYHQFASSVIRKSLRRNSTTTSTSMGSGTSVSTRSRMEEASSWGHAELLDDPTYLASPRKQLRKPQAQGTQLQASSSEETTSITRSTLLHV